MRSLVKIFVILGLLAVAVMLYAYWNVPVHQVGITSELVMLGDLNNDNRWDAEDGQILQDVLENPFAAEPLVQLKLDVNKNALLDEEDIIDLTHLYEYSEPYLAAEMAAEEGTHYPRPREFFRYLPTTEYVQGPLCVLPHKIVELSPFTFLREIKKSDSLAPYERGLLREVYNEALRFSFSYQARKDQLSQLERDYAERKIRYCEDLYREKKYFPLLLNLISLVEDAETLTTASQSKFIQKILYFRDHLQELLVSEDFDKFANGRLGYEAIYQRIEHLLQEDLQIKVDFATMAPPRDFTELQNYLDRAEWQAYKSRTGEEAFKQLVLYAQYDRRYLRAVSRTSPSLHDVQLRNHNLPMILLFREALRISGNNKKAAVALLDEAIRIPMGWVKSIPREILPSSVALENFLLPGNKEDGLDKSRHWNVFGGIAIYKSPEESLVLALKRENMDLKDDNFSVTAMREFLRDTIANINGIYYVVSIDPLLVYGKML